MILPTIEEVASLRSRLWDCGFRAVPVYNIDSSHVSPGKAPKGDKWQERARRNPPESVEREPELDALNIGILADGLRAIDIDVEDPAIVNKIKDAVLSRFGEAPIRYRSNSSRCLLLYRAAEGTPPKHVLAGEHGKVEVLGRGQQFVAFGVHHTGVPLQWVGEPPTEIAVDQLPAITEEDVGRILRFAAPLLGAKPPKETNGNGTHKVSALGMSAVDALSVVAAVSGIPNTEPANWEWWNKIGLCIWAATGGSEVGRAMWHAWSQQHDEYEESATTERWTHYATHPPNNMGAGTLFYLAKERRRPDDGPEAPPDEAPPPESEMDYGEIISGPAVKPMVALTVIRTPWVEEDIPTRPWLAPGYFLRGAVTMLSGMGSAGKSSLFVAWSTAAALGRRFGKFHTHDAKPLRVINYNVEDDADEQRRRYSAMARQLGVPIAKILENLLIVTPAQIGTLLVSTRDGKTIANTTAMNELEDLIEQFEPDLALMDPFVELHTSEENDNTAIRAVMARFRSMCTMHEIGAGILTHTRKGPATPGDPDQIRGASAIVGAARVALTLTVMSEEEANKLCIPPDLRRDYFRLDGAKKNYSRIEEAEWFQRLEYELDNGDRVAMPSPWTPTLPTSTPELLSQLHDLVAKGSPRGPWSIRLGSDPRSFACALETVGIVNRAAQKATTTSLLASGLCEVASYRRPRAAADDLSQGLRTRDGRPLAAWVDGG
jgi:hypothetical protein